MSKKNIILGIDGIPYELMNNLANKGIMPNFNELKKSFVFKKLKSSIPHISSVSWSSIITGVNPGEHGIYGFTEIIDKTYSLSYPNFNALKSKPFWQANPSKINVIINVPATYPAKKLNGIHIAGFVALDLEKAIYPPEILDILRKEKYQIDVDTKLAHQQSIEMFFNELFNVLATRKKIYEVFWDKYKWDNFMFVITSSDRLGHFLWQIYEDQNNNYHSRFLEFFREVDQIIGDIYGKLSDGDNLIILSDHGMERINQNVNLNRFLEEEKFLQLSDNLKNYNRIKNTTKAFILDPGRVYLNSAGKYPKGLIKKHEEKAILEDLKELFYSLKYKNTKVIKKVYYKDEIYHGKTIEKAPDLVLIENSGFRLKGAIGKNQIFEEDIFTGKHNDKAFLLMNKEIEIEKPSVENIVEFLN